MSTPRVGWLSGRRRRRIGAALALVVVVVVIIVVVTTGSSSPNSAAANASAATGAATVRRRDLVETDTESGTLSYDAPQTVYNRLSGTITWLPNVGQVIHAGGTLFKVDGEPVILMNGTTPAYRDLSAADSSGEDILQLNRNLVDLGFNPDGIVINDTWQAATTDGVELLQGSLGDPETGILTLGQIVFLPGDQLISTVDGTVGSTGGGGSSGANASTTVDPPAPQFVSLRVSGSTTTPTTPTTSTTSTTSTTPTTSTTTQPATTTPTTSTPTTTTPTTTSGHKKKKQHPSQSQTIAALIQLLRAENAQLQAELRAHHSGGGNGSGSGHSGSGHSGSGDSGSGDSGSGNSGSGNSGSSGGSGGTPVEILQTTSTRLVVTVDLSASSQSEAVVGEHVTVQLPDGNTVNGRITAVSPVAQNSSSGSGNGNGNGGGGAGSGGGSGNGGSSSSTIPVTIAINGHHLGAGLDQAAVSVNFVQQRANHVLSVPVTALLATSGSTYAVQNASPPYKLIPVTTGLFAAGYVQISGAGIYSGLQVTDSQG
jgi:cell division septation protein DedD